MNQLTCEEVGDLLPALARGHLDGSAAETATAHLRTCAECLGTADVLQRLLRHPIATPPALRRRVLDQLHQPARPGHQRNAWTTRRLRAAIPLAASVAVALLGAAYWFRADLRRSAEDSAWHLQQSRAQALVQLFPGWPGSDGFVAGAVVLESLSDADLEILLTELHW
jgi:hypothetical protein